MKINNNEFYFIEDSGDAETAVFAIDDISLVGFIPLSVAAVDWFALDSVDEETLYIVVVGLNDGRFAFTKPVDDLDEAAKTAKELADMCEAFHGVE